MHGKVRMAKVSTTTTTRTRVTTILRATNDIFRKSNREQQLFPAAALRICDHHLHSSGIIPRVPFDPTNGVHRIYEHDWFCVGQAVQCFAQNPNHSSLLHRILNGTDDCYCDIWVDSDSIGKSSIHFGGLISVGHDILAVVRRVFVRMAVPSSDNIAETNMSRPRPAPFNDEERKRFSNEFGIEALNISQNYMASDKKKLQDLVQVKRPDLTACRLKSRMNELETPLPTEKVSSSITRVVVGPQHINFGHHADHAFLAETAFHALTLSTELPNGYVSVQYLAEVFLGDVLESYAYCQDEDVGRMDSVIIVASRKEIGEKNVVLIAQGE